MIHSSRSPTREAILARDGTERVRAPLWWESAVRSTPRLAQQSAFSLFDDHPGIIGLVSPVHVLGKVSHRDRFEPLVVEVLHVLLESFARCMNPRMFEIGRAMK